MKAHSMPLKPYTANMDAVATLIGLEKVLRALSTLPKDDRRRELLIAAYLLLVTPKFPREDRLHKAFMYYTVVNSLVDSLSERDFDVLAECVLDSFCALLPVSAEEFLKLEDEATTDATPQRIHIMREYVRDFRNFMKRLQHGYEHPTTH